MKNKGRIYTADEGNFIVRKSDGKIMGENIDLGSADSIDNYEERPYTQEEYDDFCKTYGIKTNTPSDSRIRGRK
jgi:hypothetical protein